ncbi:ROK family protein [Lacticaseibacillus suihuaensis]
MQANRNLVRVLNVQHVMQQVFNDGPISRSQISKNLGLNKVTVSDIVSELIDSGYLLESGQGDSTRNGGRKPTILRFNANLGYVVNYDMGQDFIDRMINRLDGSVVSVERFPARDMAIEDRLALMVSIAHTDALPAGVPLLGVAVAIHGIVYQNRVLYTPFIDFKDQDIAKLLWQKLKVPIVLQNEANLSVIYERDFESHDAIDNIVCISIHSGIGAGIILNNRLYTGKLGEAGEIGQTILYDRALKAHQTPTTIESLCSETAIVERLRQAAGDPRLTREDLVARYRANDPLAITILDDFCYDIANIIYNTIITLDPRRVAINSQLIASVPELLPAITANIPHLTTQETKIYLVDDVRNCTLLGACATLIQQLLAVGPGELNFRRRPA